MNDLGKNRKIHGSYFCVSSFLIGVVIAQLTLVSWNALIVFVVCVVVMCVMAVPSRTTLVAGCIFFLLLGFYRMDNWIEAYGTPTLAEQEGIWRGYVSAEPEVREFNTRIIVTLEDSHERILVTISRYPEYGYGDYLFIDGEITLPTSFETDSGRTFHYDDFLLQQKIYYLMRYPEITRLSSGDKGNTVTRTLLRTKKKFLHQIEQVLPDPHSSLLGGLLVGAKSSMGDELLDEFRETGIIHIVVLSGFNVTIIAEAIMRTLSFLGLFGSAFFGSISILLFTIMTGASATVVRASLMAFLVIIARVTGYQSKISRALFAAGFMMVLHNPMILLYDPSFQLSFLATLGLIVLVPWINNRLTWIPQTMFDLRGLTAASIGTQMFVLPLLVWMSGEISIVSPLVNILVLWVVPATMLLGFILVVGSFVAFPLMIPVQILTYLLLGYVLALVGIFAAVPFTSIQIGTFPLWGVFVAYMFYMLIFLRSLFTDSIRHEEEHL